MQRTCYRCEQSITKENESEEHIIINAAGGRLTSKDLLCNLCNALFGDGIDSALANQMNAMTNFLLVKRHRGEARPIKGIDQATGESVLLDVGGKPRAAKPIVKKSIEGKETRFSITARNEKELKSIISGVAKKVPGFDIDAAMAAAQWVDREFSEPLSIDMEVGGDTVFRAVCKCAVNFYLHHAGDRQYIKHLLAYIEGLTFNNVVSMHYHDMYELRPEECFHLLHLKGSSEQGLLYAYIDFFNTYKYIVLLSDHYAGENMQQTYAYDVLNNKSINKEVRIGYQRDSLLKFFTDKEENALPKVKQAFQRTVAIGLKRQDEFQRNALIRNAIYGVLSKYPEGVPITQKMIDEVVEELAIKWVLREERIRKVRSLNNKKPK